MGFTAADIHQHLEGKKLPSRRFRPLYFSALVATALVILSLVVFYFTLVVASAAATLYVGFHYWSWVDGENSTRNWIVLTLFYPIVLFLGANITFLLLKPFVAQRHEKDFCYRIRRGAHPAFDALVDGIAKQMGMRPPTKIYVTAQVNAYASLGGGMKAIFGRDLELMVGLPLVSNLTVSQLGGVIAHEYGHFSQRIGMRLGLLISMVTSWFYRAAFTRDKWDAWLEARMGRDGAFDTTYIVRICNALRFILRMQAKLAVAVSSFTSRQMEYDADVPSIDFCGSEDFAETSFRLAEINYAHDVAVGNCNAFWEERRLPEDFPSFTASTLTMIDAEVLSEIREQELSQKAAWYHQHPSSAARIKRAKRRKVDGCVRIGAPATELFKDYAELAKLVTHNFYDVDCHLEVFAENLVPNAKFVREKDQRLSDQKLMNAHYGYGVTMLCPIAFDPALAASAAPTAALWERLLLLRETLPNAIDACDETCRTFFKTHVDRLMILKQASIYTAAHILIEPSRFGIPKADPFVILEASGAANAEAKLTIETFEQQNRCHAETFYTVLNLLSRAEVCPQSPAGLRAAFNEAWVLVHVFWGYEGAANTLRDLHCEYVACGLVMDFIFSREDIEEGFSAHLAKAAQTVAERLRRSRSKAIDALRSVSYPFEHANGSVSVGEYASIIPGQMEAFSTESPFQEAGYQTDLTETALNRLAILYRRMLERMAFFSENVEKLRPAPPIATRPVRREVEVSGAEGVALEA